VTTLLDNVFGSLRDAIATTPPGGTVDFHPGLSGTITLTGGELDIFKNLTIAGPGADVITVSANHASRVFYAAGTVTIAGLTIKDGFTTGKGAGIYNAGPLVIDHCTILNNSVLGDHSDGGGIYNVGFLTITDSLISGNSASQNGGGLANALTATISNSIVSGNTAHDGGGLSNSSVMYVLYSTVARNTAYMTAGIVSGVVLNQGSTLTVSSSTISDNSSTSSFGSGRIAGEPFTELTVTNSTISNNSTEGYGGGINGAYGLTLSNSTIVGNSAFFAGGINCGNGHLRDNIIAKNTATTSPDVYGYLGSQGHNLIGDGTGGWAFDASDLVGTSDNPIDPMVGALNNNGGPTETMALLAGSPAIDAGDNTDAPAWDQRGPGYPRITSDDPVIDIGAFEVQPLKFIVTNTNNAGSGSLRQAILDANTSTDLPTITFAIPGSGTQTIDVASPLPAVTRPIIVDGTSQPGYAGQPLVVVDGAAAGDGADGLTITAGDTTVKGLAIDDFTGPGIRLNDSGGDVIVANYLGTDATGSLARGNQMGIRIDSGSDDRIGGVMAADRNLISGNLGDGVAILAGSGHQILGNFIGTDLTGTKALPNDYGIELFSGSNNSIGGGSDAGAGNLISGNVYDGVGIYSDANTLQGNRIGTDVSGAAPLGNGQDGVAIHAFLHGFDNLIGGIAPGAGNVIAFNGGYGVRVTTGTGNAIRQNAIFANGAGGIALLTGGNHNEPAPALTSAISGSGMTTVEGSVMGDPSTELAVEFFANTICDPSGFGQGERYLDTATVTTDSGGLADFTVTLNQEVDPGQFITATATDPAGNTSTFSNCQVVSGAATPGHLITGTTAHRGTSTPQFLPGVAGPSPNTQYVGSFAFVLEAGPLVPIAGYTSVTPGSRRPATAVAEAIVLGDRPTANDAIASGRQETFTAFDDLLVTIGEALLNGFC
jgi:hypothetical protein